MLFVGTFETREDESQREIDFTLVVDAGSAAAAAEKFEAVFKRMRNEDHELMRKVSDVFFMGLVGFPTAPETPAMVHYVSREGTGLIRCSLVAAPPGTEDYDVRDEADADADEIKPFVRFDA